jgi:hypothetical protein
MKKKKTKTENRETPPFEKYGSELPSQPEFSIVSIYVHF